MVFLTRNGITVSVGRNGGRIIHGKFPHRFRLPVSLHCVERLLGEFAGFRLFELRAGGKGEIGLGLVLAVQGEQRPAAVENGIGIIRRERDGGIVGIKRLLGPV